jgi:tetratricopeptide (TPR) repeat protein
LRGSVARRVPKMPPPAIPLKRLLPSKEATLFKELLTLFETRQLKKGQKTADQILKKFPEHGGTLIPLPLLASRLRDYLMIETLCMKGLILVHMGKREEGVELVKKGVVLDLTSHISWHVFGLIQKIEKNYEEALKSYTQALRFDKVRSSSEIVPSLRMSSAGQYKYSTGRCTTPGTTPGV